MKKKIKLGFADKWGGFAVHGCLAPLLRTLQSRFIFAEFLGVFSASCSKLNASSGSKRKFIR